MALQDLKTRNDHGAINLLEMLDTRPLTLKELSRTVIRRHLGLVHEHRNLIGPVAALEIPTELTTLYC